MGHDFGLYCFDLKNRIKLFKEQYIQAKKKQGDGQNIGEVIGQMTRNEILAACRYFQNAKNNKKKKTTSDDEKKGSKAGQLLMKNVEKVSAILLHTQEHCNKKR